VEFLSVLKLQDGSGIGVPEDLRRAGMFTYIYSAAAFPESAKTEELTELVGQLKQDAPLPEVEAKLAQKAEQILHGMFDGPRFEAFAAAMGAICGAPPKTSCAALKW
jgi:hypothetical protein